MSDEIEPGQPGQGDLRTVWYQIRVRGELGAGWSDWFAGLRVAAEQGDTLLVGPMDQAALHAALRRVRDLGLPLISVFPLEEP
jgi:hypothetical protein